MCTPYKYTEYKIVDVFTKTKYSGNPLAIVFLRHEEQISPNKMLQIAKEFNLEETAFVFPPTIIGESVFIRVRIFTPEEEVPFAGHPSVGVAALIGGMMEEVIQDQTKSNIDAKNAATLSCVADANIKRITLVENAGDVKCEVKMGDSDIVGFATIQAPQEFQVFSEETFSVDEAASLIGLDSSDIIGQPVMAGVGLPFLMVEVESHDALRKTKPILQKFETFRPRLKRCFGMIYVYFLPTDKSFDKQYHRSKHVADVDVTNQKDPSLSSFCKESNVEDEPETAADIHARMFCPLNGGPEDPATGSAGAALIGYLGKQKHPSICRNSSQSVDGSLTTSKVKISQGVEMGRPSVIYGKYVEREGCGKPEIWIGGYVVNTMSGTLMLI